MFSVHLFLKSLIIGSQISRILYQTIIPIIIILFYFIFICSQFTVYAHYYTQLYLKQHVSISYSILVDSTFFSLSLTGNGHYLSVSGKYLVCKYQYILYTQLFSRPPYLRGLPSVRENNRTAKSANWSSLRYAKLPITVRTEAKALWVVSFSLNLILTLNKCTVVTAQT